ncbi:MAG: succinylglutamate desuccinylase/aspartoacylase family protein [Nanoarchaeota archaeon]
MKIVKINPGKEKKLFLVTGLHGNEASLFEQLKEYITNLTTEVEITLILANEEAAKKNVRYIDQDLNRIFNSKLEAPLNIEQRICQELKNIISGDLIIDFHTHSGTEKFTLLPKSNLTVKTIKFIKSLAISHCIIIKDDITDKGSLVEQYENALSIESGKHNSQEAIEFSKICVSKALDFLSGKVNSQEKVNFLEAIEFIINKTDKVETIYNNIKNFKRINIGDKISDNLTAKESFIPTLISYTVQPNKKIMLKCKEIEI